MCLYFRHVQVSTPVYTNTFSQHSTVSTIVEQVVSQEHLSGACMYKPSPHNQNQRKQTYCACPWTVHTLIRFQMCVCFWNVSWHIYFYQHAFTTLNSQHCSWAASFRIASLWSVQTKAEASHKQMGAIVLCMSMDRAQPNTTACAVSYTHLTLPTILLV